MLDLKPTDATLGAIVTGVRLDPLDASTWNAIEAAFHQYAVLIFPDQHLSSEQQVAFGRRFGDLEHLYGETGIVPITNQRRDGSLMEDAEPAMQIMHGNEGWHTDSSYMPLAAKASILSAHVVPTHGGATEWADMRAAYDALDDETRRRIESLSAYHSIRVSQARLGYGDLPNGVYGFFDGEVPLRPLVKKHPVTGRASLFIGRHAYGVPGLDAEASDRLLAELLDFACRTPRTYTHHWRAGDLAVWDNRCVLHRARPYDHAEPRVMRHTRIAGDPATEMAQVAQN